MADAANAGSGEGSRELAIRDSGELAGRSPLSERLLPPRERAFLRSAFRHSRAWSRSRFGAASVVLTVLSLFLATAKPVGILTLQAVPPWVSIPALIVMILVIFFKGASLAHGEIVSGLEARLAEAVSRERELEARLTEFPPAEIEIEPWVYLKLDPAVPDSELVVLALIFKARVTNRQPIRKLNLTFDLTYSWDLPIKVGREPLLMRLFPVRRPLEWHLTSEIFPPILEVGSDTTVTGYLSFEWSYLPDKPWLEFMDASDIAGEFKAGSDGRFVVTVHDYVSGKTVEFDVPGVWPMASSSSADTA